MPTPSVFHLAHVEALFNDLRRANSESAKKERFLQYLTTAFARDDGAQQLISAITLGAERTIANIERGGRLSTGRADTHTETVIIEWEKDLSRTGDHAREQLEEYLTGAWRSGQEYRFVLLATDGIRWRRYAPDWSEAQLGNRTFGTNFKLREIRRFDLSPEQFADFPLFLDEVLFVSRLRIPTLENIQGDFGDTSSAFINSMVSLRACMPDVERKSELQVAFEQWRRFLSIAYGRFDDSPTMFLVHTYLSVFAKFIAYSVITKKPIRDDATIEGILSGSIFQRLNIERFVEDDFFHWTADPEYRRRLRPMFQALTRMLYQYDFADVREDILKGVYQELIDLDTRHALGEYYTPDWLCEHIIDSLKITPASRFLDPACGSGSFLRAAIARMKREFPDLGAEALAEQVVGIDIHPLSVLIAKTTILLNLGPDITKARKPVTLHIYLANSLLVPRGTADLFESNFQIAVDNRNYVVNVKGLGGADDFDRLVTFCDEIVGRYDVVLEKERFERLLKNVLPQGSEKELPNQLYDVYRGMKIASDQGRDSIWKFILQNSYKPIFLMNRFDFVVGNPPWLTYAAMSNGEYQGLLRGLSDAYGVTPKGKANMPHLEIAAIFLAHSVNYFLNRSGQLAFVLPRSFLSADHHENTRSALTKGIRLQAVWDLDEVSPLFRVPSCVLFSSYSEAESSDRRISQAGIPGFVFRGRLPRAQVHWKEAAPHLKPEPKRWYYSRLQSKRAGRSALTTESRAALVGSNAYEQRFTQGATIVPRNFFFVEPEQALEVDRSTTSRIVSIRSSPAAEREAKRPWKGQTLAGRTESSLLYRTAISRNVVPFGLVDPLLVVLPLIRESTEDGGEAFTVLSSEGLLEQGLRYGSAWFFEAEKRWNRLKTDINKSNKTTLAGYLDWQKKLSQQRPGARHLLLYTSSATDASAVAIDRENFDFPFVVDHKTYWCECKTEAEAHYLAAYINSGYANGMIKDFQSRGLFGPRDIHKLIVKLPFPSFQKSDPEHKALADLGKACATLVSGYIQRGKVGELEARALGAVRSRLREEMESEFNQIDRIVEALSTGVAPLASASKRTPKRGTMRRLL